MGLPLYAYQSISHSYSKMTFAKTLVTINLIYSCAYSGSFIVGVLIVIHSCVLFAVLIWLIIIWLV